MNKDQLQFFDLFGAKQARDAGLAQVSRGPFLAAAITAIGKLPSNLLVTGEDIRVRLIQAGIVPHHHNAWGAVVKRAVEHGYLVPTGQYRHMRTERSHARKTPLYRVVGR